MGSIVCVEASAEQGSWIGFLQPQCQAKLERYTLEPETAG